MNRFPLPSDDRLEQLLRDSFESMPGPDMRRLEQLERKLLRTGSTPAKSRVNTLPWWIVLLLGGGIAAATWWAGDMILGNTNRVSVMQRTSGQIQAVEAPADSASRPADAVESQPTEGTTERESPVIYQSEGL